MAKPKKPAPKKPAPKPAAKPAKPAPKPAAKPAKPAAAKPVAAKPAKSPPDAKPAKPAKPPAAAKPAAAKVPKSPSLRSIRSAIYQVDDLAKAKAFYAAALGREPYFDQPFYVGFNVDGQELGLDPDVSKFKSGPGGSIAFWRIDDIHATWTHLLAIGGTATSPPHDVGGGMLMAIVSDPFGNFVGLIEEPGKE